MRSPTMPPLKIIILLCLYCSPSALNKQLPPSVAESAAARGFIKELLDSGLVVRAIEYGEDDHGLETTARGQVYIEALTSLPLPTQQWLMP